MQNVCIVKRQKAHTLFVKSGVFNPVSLKEVWVDPLVD